MVYYKNEKYKRGFFRFFPEATKYKKKRKNQGARGWAESHQGHERLPIFISFSFNLTTIKPIHLYLSEYCNILK